MEGIASGQANFTVSHYCSLIVTAVGCVRNAALHAGTMHSGNVTIFAHVISARVFCTPQFLKDDFGFIFAPRISRTIVLFVYQ